MSVLILEKFDIEKLDIEKKKEILPEAKKMMDEFKVSIYCIY